jgi:cbb3-type cytochrome oxidase maturation protein
MGSLVVLIVLALGFSAATVVVFIRAISTGQFDDLETPRHRLLASDDDASEGSPHP